MKITVTQQDIQQGLRNDVSCCPIALAARRILKNRRGLVVHVMNKSINFFDDYTVIQNYTLPKNAQNFVRKFDEGQEVKPFSFTIKHEN